MKSTRSFAALVTPFVLACSLLCAPVAFTATAAGENIVVAAIGGDVQVTMHGSPRAVRVGSLLATPARIRTGRDGFIEIRQGATTASLAADSEIEIAAPRAPGGLVDRIVQRHGNVLYDVAKRSGRKLRVETAYLVAVIKGTQFNVAVQLDSATVSLFEGRLEIWTPDADDFVDLNAGEIAARRRNDSTIRVLSLDTGETIRAQVERSGESTAAVVTRTAPPAEARAAEPVVNSAAVSGQVPAFDSALAGDAVVTRDDRDAATSVNVADTVTATVSTPVSIDLGDSQGNGPSNEGPPGLDPLHENSGKGPLDKGPSGEGPPAHDPIDASVGATTSLGAATVDVSVTTAVSMPADTVDLGTNVAATVAVDTTATTVDAGVGVDLGTGTTTVDVGDTTITTPSVPIVPAIVEEVVKPLRGLLGR